MILMPENVMSKGKHANLRDSTQYPWEKDTCTKLQKGGFLENIYLDGLPQQMDVKERIRELALD
jgi:hypothetical protein